MGSRAIYTEGKKACEEGCHSYVKETVSSVSVEPVATATTAHCTGSNALT